MKSQIVTLNKSRYLNVNQPSTISCVTTDSHVLRHYERHTVPRPTKYRILFPFFHISLKCNICQIEFFSDDKSDGNYRTQLSFHCIISTMLVDSSKRSFTCIQCYRLRHFHFGFSFLFCVSRFHLGLLVNGCINVVITTIEKRFGLRSSQTGLVAAGYDIASFACLVPVTYFGGRKNASKPRWIGIGMIMMGLGSMVFSLPHFLVGSYRATSVEANVCLTEKAIGNAVSFE